MSQSVYVEWFGVEKNHNSITRTRSRYRFVCCHNATQKVNQTQAYLFVFLYKEHGLFMQSLIIEMQRLITYQIIHEYNNTPNSNQ